MISISGLNANRKNENKKIKEIITTKRESESVPDDCGA